MPATSTIDEDVAELSSVRDLVRYGVTLFTRHGIVLGHGTDRMVDEAVFLVLTALELPHDELAPWLECRLTHAERARIGALYEARVVTRKPAPYLVNAAYIQGQRFYVDERVIVPRSYIGELLADGLAPVVADPNGVVRVLDMCTGSGCLAILAAQAFPNATVDAVDLSVEALAVAARNIHDYDLGRRIRLVRGDLFDALASPGTGSVKGEGADGEAPRYDVILANPPYVADAEVAAFDAEYRSEPVLAHAGGPDGLILVRRIVDTAGRFLTPDGVLVLEIGTGAAAFEASYPNLEVTWLATETSEAEVLTVTAQALAGPVKPAVGAKAAKAAAAADGAAAPAKPARTRAKKTADSADV
jgi:ribosomal protein L3 glutamine methyltransferase